MLEGLAILTRHCGWTAKKWAKTRSDSSGRRGAPFCMCHWFAVYSLLTLLSSPFRPCSPSPISLLSRSRLIHHSLSLARSSTPSSPARLAAPFLAVPCHVALPSCPISLLHDRWHWTAIPDFSGSLASFSSLTFFRSLARPLSRIAENSKTNYSRDTL
jgi:hypothetical protein